MPYLAERAGTFYLRLHVPKTIQPLIGQREIFQTLQTTDRAQAKVLALALSSQLLLNFAKVKSLMKNSKTPEEHAQLMRWINAAAVPEAEKPQDVATEAREGWSQFQLDKLANGQPYIKQADPGQDFEAAKEALRMAQEASQVAAPAQTLAQHPATVRKEVRDAFLDLKGIKPKNIHGALEDYEQELIKRRVASYKHYMAAVNHFVDWITSQHPNIQVHKVGKDHLKDYRAVLQAIRSHKKPYAPLHPHNIYKRLGFVENFFRFCQSEDWMDDREKSLPTFNLKGPKPDYDDGEDSYERFSEADLRAIFSPKNYEHIRDLPHRYWPPLIGLFTGLRRTELSDLKLDQISNFNAEKVWTLTVNQHLQKAGITETVSHKSLIDQQADAINIGDFMKASELHRQPTIHVGKNPITYRHRAEANERIEINNSTKLANLIGQLENAIVVQKLAKRESASQGTGSADLKAPKPVSENCSPAATSSGGSGGGISVEGILSNIASLERQLAGLPRSFLPNIAGRRLQLAEQISALKRQLAEAQDKTRASTMPVSQKAPQTSPRPPMLVYKPPSL